MSVIKAVVWTVFTASFLLLLLVGSLIGAIFEGIVCGTARNMHTWWVSWVDYKDEMVDTFTGYWRDR